MKIEFIDSHTHLYDEAFNNDFNEVIKKCQEAGIKKCILPGEDSTHQDALNKAADLYPEYLLPCIGVHPSSLNDNWKDELDFVKNNLNSRKYYAIGEIGLDEHFDKTYLSIQKDVFKEQLRIAYETHLPVIIHSRDATVDTFEVLETCKKEGIKIKGIFHAFSGSLETYKKLKTYGDFYFGIGGVLTFKNAKIAKTIIDIPLEDIVLETDSPYLAPTPLRGSRNASYNIPIIAEKLSQIKNTSIEEIAKITTENAESIFDC